MNPTRADEFAAESRWLVDVLTRAIPLGGAMQLEIEALDETGIVLAAPLAPNINDKGTAFGGALASSMILAGWSLPRLLLRRAGLEADLVIGRCRMEFLAPVSGAFRATCAWPTNDASDLFLQRVRARGRGKLELAPEVLADGGVAARLEARYAALAKPLERAAANGEEGNGEDD